MAETADFVVVGGGVLGLRLAIEAKERHPDQSVVLLEKENDFGLHASGRNSGVLHAGFYYASNSLKARFTRQGNLRLTDYCLERDLPINQCGKLVVAKDEDELVGLERLLRRGEANGVPLERLSETEAKEIEPRVRTHETALWSPSTATVDPAAVVRAYVAEAASRGVDLRPATPYRSAEPSAFGHVIATGTSSIEAAYVINAAGLYADEVARDFDFGLEYRLLPFKGLYLLAAPGADSLRTNIYPVPDLAKPFLGVHFTVTVDGRVMIGPTATPTLWREHYSGWANFRLEEFFEVVTREVELFLKDGFGFRSLAMEELTKHFRSKVVKLASELVEDVALGDFPQWGTPGIRAQLLDVEDNELVMDFKVQGDDQSFHVLNGVSPGFTCAIPFAEYCFDRIEDYAA